MLIKNNHHACLRIIILSNQHLEREILKAEHLQIILTQKEFCNKCYSANLVSNNEIENLNIAHVDCDAFYASIEKRDNPKYKNFPIIIGGGKRGVVATACTPS